MLENCTRGSAMKGIAICYREITWDCFPIRLCRLFAGRVRILNKSLKMWDCVKKKNKLKGNYIVNIISVITFVLYPIVLIYLCNTHVYVNNISNFLLIERNYVLIYPAFVLKNKVLFVKAVDILFSFLFN